MPETAAEALRKALRRLEIATIVIFLVVVLAVAWVWWLNGRTTQSMCALRADIQRRIHSSEAYLADVKVHPGHAIPGITPAMVRKSRDDQRRSVEALSGLHCPPITFD